MGVGQQQLQLRHKCLTRLANRRVMWDESSNRLTRKPNRLMRTANQNVAPCYLLHDLKRIEDNFSSTLCQTQTVPGDRLKSSPNSEKLQPFPSMGTPWLRPCSTSVQPPELRSLPRAVCRRVSLLGPAPLPHQLGMEGRSKAFCAS
ncbi:hypothetical protein TREES_T100015856 [Tupaia chinensis]|uniref:Uncharacterized protein n=1 Tax=Tupaia chinensis TaxID=246437 RepID=L9L226_TUPCH|nr:hypothetical protein TREES_T100015856 [Tupaia chinensis]